MAIVAALLFAVVALMLWGASIDHNETLPVERDVGLVDVAVLEDDCRQCHAVAVGGHSAVRAHETRDNNGDRSLTPVAVADQHHHDPG